MEISQHRLRIKNLSEQFPEYSVSDSSSRNSGTWYNLSIQKEISLLFFKVKYWKVIHRLHYSDKDCRFMTDDYSLALKLDRFGHRVYFHGVLP